MLFSEASVNYWLAKLVEAGVMEPVTVSSSRGNPETHYRHTQEGARLWRDNERVINLPDPWNKE